MSLIIREDMVNYRKIGLMVVASALDVVRYARGRMSRALCCYWRHTTQKQSTSGTTLCGTEAWWTKCHDDRRNKIRRKPAFYLKFRCSLREIIWGVLYEMYGDVNWLEVLRASCRPDCVAPRGRPSWGWRDANASGRTMCGTGSCGRGDHVFAGAALPRRVSRIAALQTCQFLW